MLTEQQQKEIYDFISTEAIRLRYGKLYIEINIVDSSVVDIEVETKKRILLKKK